MTKINSYLTFNGNCREAMTFYKECLGGELMMQAIEGSPMADTMPKEMKECILHSTLSTKNFVLMGSDMSPANLVKGNAVSLMLSFDNEKETRSTFEKLSNGGRNMHPLEVTFWGDLFGHLTDRYGNQWMLNLKKN